MDHENPAWSYKIFKVGTHKKKSPLGLVLGTSPLQSLHEWMGPRDLFKGQFTQRNKHNFNGASHNYWLVPLI